MTKLIMISFALVLCACSKVNIQSYSQTSPQLELEQFFDGNLSAYGMVQNRSGKVTRRFTADIEARWQDDTGYLDETFHFDNGETSKRLWKLVHHGDKNYTGTAEDVVGQAKGQIRGFAFNWVYVLTIPYKKSTIDVTLDDWLYLVSETRLINKTTLRKFGFKVGELTLVIEKNSDALTVKAK